MVFKKHESVVLECELNNNGTLAGNYTTEGRTETWQAERKSATALNSSSGVYAQYEALIGTWDVTAPDGRSLFCRATIHRGGRATLIYGMWGSFIGPGGKEDPHFEGMLVWNGVHKNLDMLLTMDLKLGRAQEQRNLQRCSRRNDRA